MRNTRTTEPDKNTNEMISKLSRATTNSKASDRCDLGEGQASTYGSRSNGGCNREYMREASGLRLPELKVPRSPATSGSERR